MKPNLSLTLVSASPLNSQPTDPNALLEQVRVLPYVPHVPESTRAFGDTEGPLARGLSDLQSSMLNEGPGRDHD
jgi:hypothetical protein